MTTLFEKMFGTFLGVEFRDDSLVVSFMKNGIGGMRMLSSSTFPLKTDDISLAEIRGYISRQGAKPGKVFVSVPDKWAITQFTGIPSIKGKGKDTLSNLMRFEIERHIPFNIEEVGFDFLLLDEKDNAYSVAFVAVQKEKMDYVSEYLEKLSLRPDAVMPSSFAVLNAVELCGVTAGGLPEVLGIMRKSNIVGRKGVINISVYLSGMHACMAVMKDGLYAYHRSFSYSPDQGPEPFISDLCSYVDDIRPRFSSGRLNALILSGDLSFVEDRIDELKEKTGTNVITPDRIPGFFRGAGKKDVNMLPASIGACLGGLGLATYTVNLLPHKMEYEGIKTIPVSTVILLALVFVFVTGIFTTEAVKRKKYLDKIEVELKKNGPVITEIEKLSSDIKGLHEQLEVLRNLKTSEITLELLREISGLLPKDAWVTNLEYKVFELKDNKKEVGELVLSGYAASSAALIPLLEDSPYLEKVAFAGPVKKTGDKEQFKLHAQVALPVQPEKKAEEGKVPDEAGPKKAEESAPKQAVEEKHDENK